MSKPIAVLISDIHFSVQNLEIASLALTAALDKAAKLGVPTVIAGDLQDTKAIIRGEVANRLILLLKQAKTPVYILVGNHDLINEKGNDHALTYLQPYAIIIDKISLPGLNSNNKHLYLIPYQSNTDEFLNFLSTNAPREAILIMHQGYLGAAMGDYIQDKSSISPDLVKDFTVISGHYHRHQTIGTVTYIGSPYTITFGEANDGPKGFLILNEDGTFTREILNLRKHVIVEMDYNDLNLPKLAITPQDLVWIKITGPRSELNKINKNDLGMKLLGHSNFKLDLIGTEKVQIKHVSKNTTPEELLDLMIDTESDTIDQKTYLKKMWRNLCDPSEQK